MSVLKLTNVTKRYGKEEILTKVNFAIEAGEMVAITGESGKGKTTLLNIIGLITSKNEGDLLLYDKKNPSIHSKSAMMLRRDKIGYLFQNYGLVEDETVSWNLYLALTYKKMDKKSKKQKIKTLLEEFGLFHLRDKMVYQLSGGEQQRIAMIRLILQDSDLILADEPTASLDSENEKIVWEYLKKLNSTGKTIVAVTHNKNILHYFSRIISLNAIHGKNSDNQDSLK